LVGELGKVSKALFGAVGALLENSGRFQLRVLVPGQRVHPIAIRLVLLLWLLLLLIWLLLLLVARFLVVDRLYLSLVDMGVFIVTVKELDRLLV
jgi:hypothetical protein